MPYTLNEQTLLMKSILFFIISFLFYAQAFYAQVVWPGDVNNNGIVNEVDLLFLGYAFGETGNPRDSIHTTWEGQAILATWAGNFPNGLNFAYADCNGDGIVDEEDAAVIEDNLNQIHDDVPLIPDEILKATQGQDPTFNLLSGDLTFVPGQTIELTIGLGDETFSIEELLGLSFTVKTDPRLIKEEQTKFEFSELSWVKLPEDSTIALQVNNPATGDYTVAISRIDQKAAKGAGLLGVLSFVIEENAIDFLMRDTITLTLDSVTVRNEAFEKVPIVPKHIFLVLADSLRTSAYNPILDRIKLYPNPTSGWVLFQKDNLPVHKVELINGLGQVVFEKKLNQNAFQSLDLRQIPKGLYWLKIISEEYGIKSKPIQKL